MADNRPENGCRNAKVLIKRRVGEELQEGKCDELMRQLLQQCLCRKILSTIGEEKDTTSYLCAPKESGISDYIDIL